jgi:hypothetical protein
MLDHVSAVNKVKQLPREVLGKMLDTATDHSTQAHGAARELASLWINVDIGRIPKPEPLKRRRKKPSSPAHIKHTPA